VGVTGVLVTGYVLSAEEQAAEIVMDHHFTDPNPEQFSGLAAQSNGDDRRLRRDTHRFCPATRAYDSGGLALHTSFERTQAGSTATVYCVNIGASNEPVPVVTRSCSSSGNWQNVTGSCSDPLRLFSAPEKKFIRESNLDFASGRTVLHNTDPTACAWECLTVYQDCVSFEIFRTGLQPRCYISSISSATDGVVFTPAKFDNMDYYELANLDQRPAIIASEDAMPRAAYTSPKDGATSWI
jgi:hypothetical protein